MSATQAFYDAMHGPRVTINVGIEGGSTGQQTFQIPKTLLCTHEWFAKALKPDRFKEGETNTITLAEDPPHAFSAFHYYIYNKDVVFTDPPASNSGDRLAYVQQLCETWIFGDKYDIPGLQNCVMFRLCLTLSEECDQSTNNDMALNTMTYCLDHTLPGAKLRNLVVDSVLHRVKGHQGHQTTTPPLEDFSRFFTPESFLQDFLKPKSCGQVPNSQVSRRNLQTARKSTGRSLKDIFGSNSSRLTRVVDESITTDEVDRLIEDSNWPRYKKPLKNAERYEVLLTAAAAAKVPVESRAVWRRAHVHTRCEHCGNDEGELCCGQGCANAFDLTCACGDRDAMRICSDCQSDAELY